MLVLERIFSYKMLKIRAILKGKMPVDAASIDEIYGLVYTQNTHYAKYFF